MHERVLLPAEGIGFDYDALDEPLRNEVIAERNEIQRRQQRAAEDIVEIGKALIRVKAALGHGQFGSWLRAEFGWSERTARRLMAVAETFPDSGQIGRFAPSALYVLAEGGVPQALRDRFLDQAARGQAVTYVQVREAVSQPVIREVHVNVTTTHDTFEIDPYVRDTETDAERDRDGAGAFPAIDLFTGAKVQSSSPPTKPTMFPLVGGTQGRIFAPSSTAGGPHPAPAEVEVGSRTGGDDESQCQAEDWAVSARVAVERARDHVLATLDAWEEDTDVAAVEWQSARRAAQDIIDAIDTMPGRDTDAS